MVDLFFFTGVGMNKEGKREGLRDSERLTDNEWVWGLRGEKAGESNRRGGEGCLFNEQVPL